MPSEPPSRGRPPSPGCESGVRRARALVRQLEGEVVDVAVVPVLTGLVGLDQRMVRLPDVRSGVPIRRRVAAADVSALGAPAEVDPTGAHEQAFDAPVAARRDRLDVVEMGAVVRHALSLASASSRAVVAGPRPVKPQRKRRVASSGLRMRRPSLSGRMTPEIP